MVDPGAFGSPEPDVPLDTSWPGLDPGGRQVTVDPDAMEHLAEMLLAECDSIRDEYGGGTLKHFEDALGRRISQPGSGPFGGWRNAAAVDAVHYQIYDYAHQSYKRLVDQLEAAAQALKAAADAYRNADHNTLAALPPASSTTAVQPVRKLSPGHGSQSAGDYRPAAANRKQSAAATDFEGLDG